MNGGHLDNNHFAKYSHSSLKLLVIGEAGGREGRTTINHGEISQQHWWMVGWPELVWVGGLVG